LYNLIFYTNVQDDSPIDDFLDSLDKKSRAMENWLQRFPTGVTI